MNNSVLKAAALAGMALTLGACQMNSANYVKSADGSVQIVDSNPGSLQPVVEFYRTEGRNAAKICERYGSSNSRVTSELLKLGFSEGEGLFGPTLKKKAPSLMYAPVKAKQASPCSFTFASISGEHFYQGAKASLIELGYTQTTSETWMRGSKKIKMTGSVTTSSYGASSQVEISSQ